jgi:hypothetical protein
MAYEEDIKERRFGDRLKAHISFLKPLHRYQGDITLLEDKIIFKGKDTKTKGHHSLEIDKSELKDVYLGFDDVFKRIEDRSIGFAFKPLRLKFVKNNREFTTYFIIHFKRTMRTTKNEEWYEEIEKWTS